MQLTSLKSWVIAAPSIVAILLVRLYQVMLSPFLGGNCRFYPSCSSYTIECFKTLPFHRACLHSIRRLLSCHPMGRCGYDPIPPRSSDV